MVAFVITSSFWKVKLHRMPSIVVVSFVQKHHVIRKRDVDQSVRHKAYEAPKKFEEEGKKNVASQSIILQPKEKKSRRLASSLQ